METHGDLTLLTRIDPSRNMARFYSLSIEPTLFGGFVLHRSWGRLGTWGQSRLEYCPDLSAAHARKEQLTELKVRRGYVRR